MPTYTCMLNDLSQLIGEEFISLEELETYLECAKSELKGYDEASGELKLENNDTNRPDLWSAEGTARQIRNSCYKRRDNYPFFETNPELSDRIIVSPNLETIRPFIGGFRVTGLTVTETLLLQLIQTQEKLSENFGRARDLLSIGLYDASRIVLPIHYKGVLPGEVRFTPLDFTEEMDLETVLKQHPKGIQYAHILRGSSHYPVLMDSNGAVLSFPPIINSNDLGRVVPGNTHLFVEATGKEREAVTLALNILACNIADRGGEIHTFAVHNPKSRMLYTPWKFKRTSYCDLKFAEVYVGEEIKLDKFISKLQDMGHELISVNEDTGRTEWSAPPYRLDCLHQVDLVEDFCIAYGYNNFVPQMPEKFTVGLTDPLVEISNTLRELMLGMSFQEVMNYILTSRDTLCSKMKDDDNPLEIENVMSESYKVLRSRILPILLEIEAQNPKSEYPHRLFEIGEVAKRDETSDEGTITLNALAALVAHPAANFSEIHSVLQALLYYLGISYSLEKTEHPSYLAGRAGKIIINGKPCGIIGEIHPEVLENWSIGYPCAAFELYVNPLLEKPQEKAHVEQETTTDLEWL